MKYEDSGELAKAIESYSKSMEITEPFALGLYYRGLAYLKLRQLDNARLDIMKALEFQPEIGLDSYDRGQATKLLHQIDNNNQIS
jgi:tetratricopeptide (TPR) repeat protein